MAALAVLVLAVLLAFFYPAYASFLPVHFAIDDVEARLLAGLWAVVGGTFLFLARRWK